MQYSFSHYIGRYNYYVVILEFEHCGKKTSELSL